MANFTFEHNYTYKGHERTATKKSGKMFSLQFSGANEMLTRFTDLSASGAAKAIGQALRETHKTVTPKLHAEMQKHNKTGIVERSIVDTPRVTIEGDYITMPIGFDIDNGGLPSIWLMYGTPKQAPDKALYEAIFGRKTAAEIAKVQRAAIKHAMDVYINGGVNNG